MKKSEKIEIRISHEDKERLTRLAEHEGQSVSELVRGLARRYVEMYQSGAKSAPNAWLKTAGLTVAGALFGVWLGMHVLYPHFAHAHEVKDQYDIAFSVAGGELGEARYRGWLIVRNHGDTVDVLGLPGDDLPLTITAVPGQKNGHINVSTCLDTTDACVMTDIRLTRNLQVTEAQFPDGARITYSLSGHRQSHDS